MAHDPLHGDDEMPSSRLALWWEASRPRTLPASIAPVLAGTAASDRLAYWFSPTTGPVGETTTLSRPAPGPLGDLLAAGPAWGRFALALVVALSLQIAVNFANDYFDGIRGVDTEDRVGPRRLTAAGLVTRAQMQGAIALALGMAVGAGVWLSLLVNPWLLLFGAGAVLATLGYSGGPTPYASRGLGELFVFVFFGLVATVGSQYVQDEQLNLEAVLAGVAMGLWAVALLVVNNLRDVRSDEAAGKRTMAVRIGEPATRAFYVACVAGAFVVALVLVGVAGEAWLALPLLTVPLVWPAIRLVRQTPPGPRLVVALGMTARAQLVYALLLTVGLLLRDPTSADGLLTGWGS